MPAQTLKEYLVNIGWSSDAFGLNKVKKDINTIKGSLGKLSATNVAKIGTTLLSGAVQLGSAVWNIVDGVAQADIEAQRFARKMWISAEAAKSFQDASEITGMTWDDLFYSTGEEVRHFMELKSLSTSLNAPPALEDGLKLIRSINYEVDKLKVIAKQAMRWVAYYFTKMNGRDLQQIRQGLKDFNAWVIKNIPAFTQKIAFAFTIMLKFGKAFIALLNAGREILTRFFGVFDRQVLGTAGVLGGLFTIIKAGPIGWIIAALTTILLLVDDYTTWARGGHSTLGALWENLGRFQDFLDSETVEEFGSTINGLLKPLTDLLLIVIDLLGQFIAWLDEIGAFDAIRDSFLDVIHAWTDALQGLDDILNLVLGRFDKISENSFLKKYLNIDTENGTFEGVNWGNIGKVSTGFNFAKDFLDYYKKNNPLGWGQLLGENIGTNLANYLAGNSATAAYYGAGGNTTNKSLQMNNKIDININGNADGQEIGRKVVDSLDNFGFKFSFK